MIARLVLLNLCSVCGFRVPLLALFSYRFLRNDVRFLLLGLLSAFLSIVDYEDYEDVSRRNLKVFDMVVGKPRSTAS